MIQNGLGALRGRCCRQWAGGTYAHYVIETRVTNSTALLFFATLVAILVIVATTNFWALNEFSTVTDTSFPWVNYCRSGVQSECFFMGRSLNDVQTREQGLRFIRNEIVTYLWRFTSQATPNAADVPMGSVWLIGALLVRATPSRASAEVYSCETLNSSVTFYTPSNNRIFSCGASHYVIVPFNSTAMNAYALLEEFNVGSQAMMWPSLCPSPCSMPSRVLSRSTRLCSFLRVQDRCNRTRGVISQTARVSHSR